MFLEYKWNDRGICLHQNGELLTFRRCFVVSAIGILIFLVVARTFVVFIQRGHHSWTSGWSRPFADVLEGPAVQLGYTYMEGLSIAHGRWTRWVGVQGLANFHEVVLLPQWFRAQLGFQFGRQLCSTLPGSAALPAVCAFTPASCQRDTLTRADSRSASRLDRAVLTLGGTGHLDSSSRVPLGCLALVWVAAGMPAGGEAVTAARRRAASSGADRRCGCSPVVA